MKATLTEDERETFFELVSISGKRRSDKTCSSHRISIRARDPRLFNRAYYIVLKEMFGLEACVRQKWWTSFKQNHPDEAARDEAAVQVSMPATPTRVSRPQRRRSASTSTQSSRQSVTLLTPFRTPLSSSPRRPPRSDTPPCSDTSPRSGTSRRSVIIRTHRGGYPAQLSAAPDLESDQLQARIQLLEHERNEKEAQILTLEAQLYQTGGRVRQLEALVDGLRQFTTGFSQILDQLPA